MKEITIKSAMHLKSESGEYHLVRYEGQDAFNFVHFLDPVVVVTEYGEVKTEKDACIIYSPHIPQEYYALPGGFTNDFVTFSVDDLLYVSRYNLPENQVFYVADGKRITEIVEYISWACFDFQVDHQEDLLSHVHLLLQTLSDSIVSDTPRNQRNYMMKKQFFQLREQMRQSPQGWTVEKMAKAVYLTRSRFTVLYQEIFQTAPKADLIDFTITFAKKQLTGTTNTIAEIARNCGYSSVEHFIRIFRKAEGVTPGQYRKEHLEKMNIKKEKKDEFRTNL